MTREEQAKKKFDKKVASIANNHYTGRGKTEKVRKLIEDSLQQPCPYCGKMMKIDNIELDHRVPLIRKKIKNKNYSETELEYLNSDENKILCCSACNKAKGDYDYQEWISLIEVLRAWERHLELYVHGKIKHSPEKGSFKSVVSRLAGSNFKFRRFN